MSAMTGPEFDPETAQQVRAVTQQAVDATSTAYTEDASTDVEQRLRREMSDRGLDVDDEEWIAEVGQRIRSGHGVVFDDPNLPGSLGGDNGGG